MLEKEPKKTLEQWKDLYLKKFKSYHDDYSDEIPKQMLHGDNSANYKYKVRGNWFFAVRSSLQNCEILKMFPEEFNQEWKDFFSNYSKRMIEAKGEGRTTGQDLETANRILLKAQEIIKGS